MVDAMQAYYKAISMKGQDKPNRELWLATQAGNMMPCSPQKTTHCVPHEKSPQNHTMNLLLAKLVWSRWQNRGLIPFFWWVYRTLPPPRSINTQKKKRTRPISCPHAWSITHMYQMNNPWSLSEKGGVIVCWTQHSHSRLEREKVVWWRQRTKKLKYMYPKAFD